MLSRSTQYTLRRSTVMKADLIVTRAVSAMAELLYLCVKLSASLQISVLQMFVNNNCFVNKSWNFIILNSIGDTYVPVNYVVNYSDERRRKRSRGGAYLVWPCLEVNPHDKA